ncbi:MAG: AI-2E family transporter [Lentisphaeria bacterium]|nr:AI-2E family transporter [Lentisphaeria bacterium]
MSILREIGKGLSELRRESGNALRGSFNTAASFFRSKESSRSVCYRFLKYLFTEEGELDPRSEALFCRVMDESAPDVNAEQVWQELEQTPLCKEKEIVEQLLALPLEKREHFIRLAAAMIHRPDGIAGAAEKLAAVVRAAGMAEEKFQEILDEIAQSTERRRQLLRSGAGVIAALIVIAVFILTATLLRSVIFGLIIAYLLLPLEQYLEQNWRRKKGIGFFLGSLTSALCWLPRKLAAALKRKESDPPTPEQLAHKEEQKIIARAVGQTAFAVLVAFALLAGGVYMLSSYYFKGISEKFRTVAAAQSVAPPGAETSAAAGKNTPVKLPVSQLQKIREKLMTFPAARYLIEKAESTLRDEKTRNELATMLWRRSGGVFSFLFNVMGFVGTLVCDLLLALFFGMLFLMKMAEYKNSADENKGGNYAVRTILVSRWLPNVSESTLAEAQRILSGVFSRLRIWVRGYLTLVVIDSTVYTILFGILHVPYFPILGIIAGCGLLLPYVGPILSCALTLLVTYLAGDAGVTQLVLILGCYLLYNGVVEQFILYPMVIGESLGLTTLETIIVVLLGAIFAGIPGMILALPAASVIKYLVPQIYRCWDVVRKDKKISGESSGA